MDETIRAGLKKAGLVQARRHIFVCIGPDCCSLEAGEAVWAHIKQRLSEAGLPVMRTKAACLRVCSGGPWLVVYPEGVWYGRVDAERFDRILGEHLIGGTPVAAWIEARNCLEGDGEICG
jgi:(2Fe-2S) ferredoxin